MTARRRLRLGALVGGAAFLFTACASNAPQDSLDPAGPFARKIDALFMPVFWIAVGVFVLVEGLLVLAIVKFRHRPGRDKVKQVHGNTRLEIIWTIIPALILAGVAVPTIATIFELSRRPPGDAVEITVTGNQWWWDVQYPQFDVRTANEIHIPVGRPVFITLKSNDVIHSFSVPRLAGKQDMVPGQDWYLSLQADEPGTYPGQCAEFCGLSHANMRFTVVAQTEADFQEWVSLQQQEAAPPVGELAQKGFNLFMQPQLCLQCHAIQGTEASATTGPDLTHFAGRQVFAGAILENTPEELARWLADSPSVKPGSLMPDYGCEGPSEPVVGEACLTPEQIEALIAYLESLE